MDNAQVMIDRIQTNFRDQIAKNGFAVQLVIGSFGYTVGMANHGLPDLFIHTNSSKLAVVALSEIAARMIKGEQCQGRVNSHELDTLNGEGLYYDVVTMPLTERVLNNYVVQAVNFYESYPEALRLPMSFNQLVYCDDNGILPYSPSYNHKNIPQEIFTYDYFLKSERPQ